MWKFSHCRILINCFYYFVVGSICNTDVELILASNTEKELAFFAACIYILVYLIISTLLVRVNYNLVFLAMIYFCSFISAVRCNTEFINDNRQDHRNLYPEPAC